MGFDAGLNFFELERLGYVVHCTGPECLPVRVNENETHGVKV